MEILHEFITLKPCDRCKHRNNCYRIHDIFNTLEYFNGKNLEDLILRISGSIMNSLINAKKVRILIEIECDRFQPET